MWYSSLRYAVTNQIHTNHICYKLGNKRIAIRRRKLVWEIKLKERCRKSQRLEDSQNTSEFRGLYICPPFANLTTVYRFGVGGFRMEKWRQFPKPLLKLISWNIIPRKITMALFSCEHASKYEDQFKKWKRNDNKI